MFTAASPRVRQGHLLAALELVHNDGPWVRADDFRKFNGLLRYSRGDTRNGFSITGQGYAADWAATDQVPQRAIDSGADLTVRRHRRDRRAGERRSTAWRQMCSARPVGSSTRATAYVFRYGLNLISNFTYLLADPVNGDQIEQEDRRTVAGGRLTHRRFGHVLRSSRRESVRRPAASRRDRTGDSTPRPRQRRLGTIRQDEIGQTSAGLFAQSEIEWGRKWFRTTARTARRRLSTSTCVRTTRSTPAARPTASVSPKFTAVIGPWQLTEFYVNYGPRLSQQRRARHDDRRRSLHR